MYAAALDNGCAADVCGCKEALRYHCRASRKAYRVFFAFPAEEGNVQAQSFRCPLDKGHRTSGAGTLYILRHHGIQATSRQTSGGGGVPCGKCPVSHGCIRSDVAVSEAQLCGSPLSAGAISGADSLPYRALFRKLHEGAEERAYQACGGVSAADAHCGGTSRRTYEVYDGFFFEYRYFHQGGRIP